MLNPTQALEWQSAAMWCARRGYFGKVPGEPLPPMLSDAVYREIVECPDEWAADVKLAAYAWAMASTTF
jgi:hypothetical protein